MNKTLRPTEGCTQTHPVAKLPDELVVEGLRPSDHTERMVHT